jgi:hypothetical protein
MWQRIAIEFQILSFNNELQIKAAFCSVTLHLWFLPDEEKGAWIEY